MLLLLLFGARLRLLLLLLRLFVAAAVVAVAVIAGAGAASAAVTVVRCRLVLGLVWEGLRKQQFEANGLTTLRSFTLLIEGFVISLESQAHQVVVVVAVPIVATAGGGCCFYCLSHVPVPAMLLLAAGCGCCFCCLSQLLPNSCTNCLHQSARLQSHLQPRRMVCFINNNRCRSQCSKASQG